MEVESKIRIHEINGEATRISHSDIYLVVRNVWNKNDLVELQVGNEKAVVVHKYDLLKAIDNATGNER